MGKTVFFLLGLSTSLHLSAQSQTGVTTFQLTPDGLSKHATHTWRNTPPPSQQYRYTPSNRSSHQLPHSHWGRTSNYWSPPTRSHLPKTTVPSYPTHTHYHLQRWQPVFHPRHPKPLYRPPSGSTFIIIGNYSFYHHGSLCYIPIVSQGRTYYRAVYSPFTGAPYRQSWNPTEQPPHRPDPSSRERDHHQDGEPAIRLIDGRPYQLNPRGQWEALETVEQPTVGQVIHPEALRHLLETSRLLASLDHFAYEVLEIHFTPVSEGPPSAAPSFTRQFAVQRPHKVSSRTKDREDGSRFWFNGETLSSTQAKSSTLESSKVVGDLDHLIRNIGLDGRSPQKSPSLFWISSDLYGLLSHSLQEARLRPQQEPVGKHLCNVIELIQDASKTTLWIDSQSDFPLLRQIQVQDPSASAPASSFTITSFLVLQDSDPSLFAPPADLRLVRNE